MPTWNPWRGRREDAQTDFSGQSSKSRQHGDAEHRKALRYRHGQANMLGPVLRLLDRTAVTAILGGLLSVPGVH